MYWVFLSIPADMQQHNITAWVAGPLTKAQFTAKYGNPDNGVNPVNGFPTKLQAQAGANKYNRNPGKAGGVDAPGAAPGINAPNPFGTNPLSGIAAIGDLANRLTQPNTWVRVGEFLAGGILLVIGVNAMTKGPVQSATSGTIRSGAKKAIAVGKAIK
jgi:hypothetical protein